MADLTKTIINYVSPEKLSYYDTRLKAWVTAADDTLKAELQGKIDAANTAISNEETRAKAAEATNAAAAQAAQNAVDALAGKVGEVAEGKTVMGIINEIQENAYDDTALRAELEEELNKKADKEQVALDIAAAVKAEEDARKEAVAGVQGAVDALSGTHATDKKDLEDAIALKADQTALDAVSAVANAAVKQADYDVKVKALEDEDVRIAGLVATEAETARAAEEANAAAIKAITDDYLKKADKDELAADIKANADAIAVLNGEAEGSVKKTVDDALNKFATDVTNDEVVNSYKELIDWAAEHGGEAAEMAGAIDALEGLVGEKSVATQISEAIAAENLAQYAKDADLDAAVERLEALEAIDHEHANKAELDLIASGDKAKWDAAAAIAHEHANAEVLSGITAEKVAAWDAAEANAKSHAEAKVAELADGAVATNAADIDKLEESLAEGGATANAIAEAKKAGTDAQAAADKAQGELDSLEEVVGTKAAQADLEAVAGRVTTAEGEIDTLQSEMDAVEAKAAANETAIGTKASQTDLDSAVARVEALEAVQHVEIEESAIDEMFA